VLNSKRSAGHATGGSRRGDGRYVAGGWRGRGAGHVCGGVGYSAGDRDRDFYPACLRFSPSPDAGTGKREERAVRTRSRATWSGGSVWKGSAPLRAAR